MGKLEKIGSVGGSEKKGLFAGIGRPAPLNIVGEGGKVVNPMNQTPKTPFSGVMDESAGAKEMKRGDSDDSGGVRVSTMKVSDRKYSYDGSEACESKHEWG